MEEPSRHPHSEEPPDSWLAVMEMVLVGMVMEVRMRLPVP